LPITGTWRDWRPAIWLAMLGIAVMLLVSPFYFGALFIGAGIGAAIRIRQRRRRAAAIGAAAVTSSQSRQRRGSQRRSRR
jgi:hypothetical protein